jgi:hypothetical protein
LFACRYATNPLLIDSPGFGSLLTYSPTEFEFECPESGEKMVIYVKDSLSCSLEGGKANV